MFQQGPSLTTDDVFAGKVSDITVNNVLSSTAAAYNDVPIFLQTPGAKAIAGVFAFASILVTCVQVSCSYIHEGLVRFCQGRYVSSPVIGLCLHPLVL